MKWKNKTSIILVILLILFVQIPSIAAEPYVVVVNPKNPVSEISKDELKDIFLLKKIKWDSGDIIEPVHLQKSSLLNKFLKDITDNNFAKQASFDLDSARFLMKEAFLGRSAIPKILPTEKKVIEFILKNEGGIGYISHADSSVKVIPITGVFNKQNTKKPPIMVTVPKPIIKPTVPKPVVLPKIKKPAKNISFFSESIQTFKVNDEGAFSSKITIINSNTLNKPGTSIRSSNDIRIHIPNNLKMQWDRTLISLLISGDAKGYVNKKVRYSPNNKTLIIDVLKDFPSEGKISISGMKFKNFVAPSNGVSSLLAEIDNKGNKNYQDDKFIQILKADKPKEIVTIVSNIVITKPLKKTPPIGGRVNQSGIGTTVAGKPFEVEIYLTNDKKERINKSARVTMTDDWITPSNPPVKKHTSVYKSVINVKQGYAKMTVTYLEAGEIRLLAKKDSPNAAASSISFYVRPAYFTINIASCAIAGDSAAATIKAVNMLGSITKNYRSTFSLYSNFAGKNSTPVSDINPSRKTKIPIKGGTATIDITYADAGSIRLSAQDNSYTKKSVITTKNPQILCFRPSSLHITYIGPPGKRSFFYTKTPSCSKPEYVALTVSAVNSNGKTTKGFTGTVEIEASKKSGLSIPPQQVTPRHKGVKQIKKKIYSTKEQTVKLKAKGSLQDSRCGCSTFTSITKPIPFKKGTVVITKTTGMAGGITRQRQGRIVKVTRAGTSGEVIVPVSLQFTNGKIIKEDSSTVVNIAITDESGDIKNSASIHGKSRFTMKKGTGSVKLSNPEGETVTLRPKSKPCLAAKKGVISFVDDRIVVLPSRGSYNEDVHIKIEVQNKSGKIIKRHDGLIIEDVLLEPARGYIMTSTTKPVIKNGMAMITIRNTNPQPKKIEQFLVKIRLKNSSLTVHPAKIRFKQNKKKSGSGLGGIVNSIFK